MVLLNRSIFRTTGSPTCRFFCAQIEIETDRDLSDDLPTAASGALMAMPRDPFVPRENSPGSARPPKSGRGIFRPLPKKRYQTEVESWRHLQSQVRDMGPVWLRFL